MGDSAASALAATTLVLPAPWSTRDANVPDGPTCPTNAKPANLDFTLADVDGRPVRLADYAGKVLLLDFWATWCPPCRGEIPAFAELYARYWSTGFEVAGGRATTTPSRLFTIGKPPGRPDR